MMTLAQLVLTAIVVNATANQAQEKPQICYVVGSVTTAFASPSPLAKQVNSYKALAVVGVLQGTKGYALVKPFTKDSTADIEGWIPVDPDYLIPDGCFDGVMRRVQTNDHPTWSQATKRDIIARRIKIGFSKTQTQLALGDPVNKSSEETAAGTTAIWVYRSQSVTFKGDTILSIRRIE